MNPWQRESRGRTDSLIRFVALAPKISRCEYEGLEIDEPVRDTLLLDKDTMGVPGSPPIFQTILTKIDRASAFVADLSFCGKRVDDRPTPNPNVLIEHGWALKALGFTQVLAVMNTLYGEPTPDSMPFDLASLRFPITYKLPEDSSDSTRQSERDQLAKKLETALRTIFESEEFIAKLPKRPEPPLFHRIQPLNGRARFRAPGKPLGVTRDQITQEESAVSLAGGPAMWLRVTPLYDPGRTWLNEDIRTQATPLSTVPLVQIRANIGFLRSDDGCGYYRGYDVEANSVAYVFNSGELWIINASTVRSGSYIQFDESSFTATLDYCALFLEGLGCARPYQWIAGIEGIRGRHVVFENGRRAFGPCVADVIEEEGIYAKDAKAANLLPPFFEKVFDKCGARRPSPSPRLKPAWLFPDKK